MSRNQDLKQIKMNKAMGFKELMGDRLNPLTVGWCFDKWYEKIILLVLMALGVWKLGGFFI